RAVPPACCRTMCACACASPPQPYIPGALGPVRCMFRAAPRIREKPEFQGGKGGRWAPRRATWRTLRRTRVAAGTLLPLASGRVVLGRDAGARVAPPDGDAAVRQRRGGETDAPFAGELRGVREQVLDDDAQLGALGRERRKARGNVGLEGDRPIVHEEREPVGELAQQRDGIDRLGAARLRLGLEPGEVEELL